MKGNMGDVRELISAYLLGREAYEKALQFLYKFSVTEQIKKAKIFLTEEEPPVFCLFGKSETYAVVWSDTEVDLVPIQEFEDAVDFLMDLLTDVEDVLEVELPETYREWKEA